MAKTLPASELKVLIEADRIHEEVFRLAARIEAEYADKPLTVLGVLKGSVFFLVDLIRLIRIPLHLEFIRASSYGEGTTSSGEVMLGQLESSLEGRHVLVVDDILDSGRTLAAIVAEVQNSNPASVKTCVLVDKQTERAVDHEADYRAFRIPEVFIVGYGLDYAEQHRNLPYIASINDLSFLDESSESDEEARANA